MYIIIIYNIILIIIILYFLNPLYFTYNLNHYNFEFNNLLILNVFFN
jgi:hypothetical protein